MRYIPISYENAGQGIVIAPVDMSDDLNDALEVKRMRIIHQRYIYDPGMELR